MNLLFASSEVVPFSKTGGLADVVGALPFALRALGHELLVVSPWYRTLQADPAPLWIGDVEVPFHDGFDTVGVGTLERNGVRFVFVGHPSFDRPSLYGFEDDAYRFARFTRAVPAVAERVGFLPDVVHAHDWHTGYLPALLAEGWHLPAGWPGLPSVFTIHNVQHQGWSPLDATIHWLRLPTSVRSSGMNHFGTANAMQAGLDFATRVTTVSPTYANEIQRPEFGFMLDGTLRSISGKLTGILNGLDVRIWDPANDPAIPEPFSARNPRGKDASKVALRDRFELEEGRPILATVSRFAEQKGIDLLLEAAPGLIEDGWNLVVQGSGDEAIESWAEALAREHPRHVGVHVGYDETLAHLIYAGSDAFAIPSRFEPCGLTQMIAMRYGSLPIARATGGLRDTIRSGETGFLFFDASATALRGTAQWALALLKKRPRALQKAAMREVFDWKQSAEAYAALYRDVRRAQP